jgi:hypothetical protein
LQVGLEDWFEHQHGSRHGNTIFDRRNSQRSGTPWLARFGYQNPPNRFGTIPSRPQFFRQFVQPPLHPVLLDVLERLAIDARRSVVLLTDAVGVSEHVRPIHLVVQRVEPIAGRSLRFGMQRRL